MRDWCVMPYILVTVVARRDTNMFSLLLQNRISPRDASDCRPASLAVLSPLPPNMAPASSTPSVAPRLRALLLDAPPSRIDAPSLAAKFSECRSFMSHCTTSRLHFTALKAASLT